MAWEEMGTQSIAEYIPSAHRTARVTHCSRFYFQRLAGHRTVTSRNLCAILKSKDNVRRTIGKGRVKIDLGYSRSANEARRND
jgi:hypothetical protein